MPLEAQAKLLRVLQSREVFPLGATAPEHVDVRVVCATHRNLEREVKEGRFRGDLFARVSEHMVVLPPLRERKEDILRLAQLFGERYGTQPLTLSFSFMVALLHYDWPFNVRELESCIKRAVALAESQTIDSAQLPDAISSLMRDYGRPASRSAPASPSVIPAPPAPSLQQGAATTRHADRGRFARPPHAASRQHRGRRARARQGADAGPPLDEAVRDFDRGLPLRASKFRPGSGEAGDLPSPRLLSVSRDAEVCAFRA